MEIEIWLNITGIKVLITDIKYPHNVPPLHTNNNPSVYPRCRHIVEVMGNGEGGHLVQLGKAPVDNPHIFEQFNLTQKWLMLIVGYIQIRKWKSPQILQKFNYKPHGLVHLNQNWQTPFSGFVKLEYHYLEMFTFLKIVNEKKNFNIIFSSNFSILENISVSISF